MINMVRPDWNSIRNPSGFVQCTCGNVLQNLTILREHWQMGHFDYVEQKDMKPIVRCKYCGCDMDMPSHRHEV